MTTSGLVPGPDPRQGRQDAMVVALRVVTMMVASLAGLALALGSSRGEGVAVAVGVLLVVAPVGRVGWLLVRWVRKRDWRYALTAGGLLCVVGLAVGLS